MIIVDGTTYNFPCDISRKARIVSSDVSGMLMDNTEYNDALATYYDYTIKIAIPITDMNIYAAFFEQVTAPAPSHTFTFPYNQGNIDIVAKVESISDRYFREVNGVQVWRSVQLNIHALKPSKEA
ncbi:MAG: hypothetical protein IKR76_01895 [Ruminococcus sp.]|nr:hypothetical protein [Ruminococcus sp.]